MAPLLSGTHGENSYSVLASRDNAAITNKKKTEVLANTFVMICNSIVYLRRKEKSDTERARARERDNERAITENTHSLGRKFQPVSV